MAQKADFGGTARLYAVGFSIGSKGYIGKADVPRDFWEYDPTTNTWVQEANFPAGEEHWSATGFNIGTKGYLGLVGSNGYLLDFFEFNPATHTWTAIAGFGGEPRCCHVSFSIGNKDM